VRAAEECLTLLSVQSPPSLSKPHVLRPSPQGTPEALPYPSLRRLSSATRPWRSRRCPSQASCPAPHSPRRTAGPRPGECRAGAGTLRRGCPAERPGRRRAAGRGLGGLGWVHAVPVGVPLACSLLPLQGAAAVLAAGGLAAFGAESAAAAPHASAHVPCPYSPRHRRQSTRSGRESLPPSRPRQLPESPASPNAREITRKVATASTPATC
jgi:hypothetical protein